MCGGGACAGNFIYVFEKLVTYTAMAAVALCLLLTICISIGIGAGIGYNYCFVDHGAKAMAKERSASAPGKLKSRDFEMVPEDFREPAPQARRSGNTATATSVPTTVSPVTKVDFDDKLYTLSLKLHDNLDFSALIAKLRARNKNTTLELIS